MNEIFSNPRPLNFHAPSTRRKVAPAQDFDFNLPDGCIGICLGSCYAGRPCPFLGCHAAPAAFARRMTQH